MKNKKAKIMIERISTPVDLYGVVMLDLPWIKHPFEGMGYDRSKGRDARVFRKAQK